MIRIPPAGGGMFAEYDFEGQTRTQELLHRYGVATPSPVYYEPDSSWIGSRFMVMPRIVGHTPSDTSYATRGWLHDSGPKSNGEFMIPSSKLCWRCSGFPSTKRPGSLGPRVSA